MQKQNLVLFRLLDLHSQFNSYHSYHPTHGSFLLFLRLIESILIIQYGFTLSSVILGFKAFLRLLLGFHHLRFDRPSQGLKPSSSELAPRYCLLCSSVILTQTFIHY